MLPTEESNFISPQELSSTENNWGALTHKFRIIVFDKQDNQLGENLQDFSEASYAINLNNSAIFIKTIQQPSTTSFSGYPAYTYQIESTGFESGVDGLLHPQVITKVIIIEKDGTFILLAIPQEDFFNQIPSTFKFTD